MPPVKRFEDVLIGYEAEQDDGFVQNGVDLSFRFLQNNQQLQNHWIDVTYAFQTLLEIVI